MDVSRLTLVLFALAATGSNLQAGTPYHSREGFTINIPDNWTQIPDQKVQEMARQAIPGATTGKVIVDSGFARKGVNGMEFPYVLVQVIKHPVGKLPNDEDMREIVSRGSRSDVISEHVSSEVRQLLKDAKMSNARYDADKKTYLFGMQANVPGLGEMRGSLMGHVGKNAMVQICCYDLVANYATHEGDFASILDSFKFDADAAYPQSDSDWRAEKSGELVGGIVGVSLVGVFFYFRARARRRKHPMLDGSELS